MVNPDRFARMWLLHATQDRDAARALAVYLPCPMGIVCFHAQQCVEKMLKGALALNEAEIPRTHDLVKLLGLCQPHAPTLARLEENCLFLTAFAIQGRYPDEPQVDECIMQRALKDLEAAWEQLRPLFDAIG